MRVILLPGQGTSDARLLQTVREQCDAARWARVESALGERFGIDGAAALKAENAAERFDQLVVWLSGVLSTERLLQPGDVLVGHSAGEITALSVAGALSFEASLNVVMQRMWALEHHAPVGVMLALNCAVDRTPVGEASIAVLNHGDQTVLSGRPEVIVAVEAAAATQRIATKRLRARYAFHSPDLAPAVEPLRAALASVELASPSHTVFSMLEGRRIGDSGLGTAAFLADHLTRTLDFAAGIKALFAEGHRHFIDVSRDGVLAPVVRRIAVEEKLKVKVDLASKLPKEIGRPHV